MLDLPSFHPSFLESVQITKKRYIPKSRLSFSHNQDDISHLHYMCIYILRVYSKSWYFTPSERRRVTPSPRTQPLPCPPCQVLLKRRLAPTAIAGEGSKSSGASNIVLGTLSAVVGHPLNGYLPLPLWCTVQPDSSVREPPKEEPRALAASPGVGSRGMGDEGGAGDDFYSGSSPEYSSDSEDTGSGSGSGSDSYDSASDSESRSDSESDSQTVSGSDSGSGSESDSGSSGDDSGSSVGSRSRSSSESSSGESTASSATKGEEGVGLLNLGPGAMNTAATSYGASAPAPHSQDLTGLVERMSVADREDSASPQFGGRDGGLASLSIAGVVAGVGAPVAGVGGLGRTLSLGARSASVHSDISLDPESDTSVSFPSTLLRHQAGEGLQVDYQYTRGRAGSMSRPSTTLILRLTFTNHRDTPIRCIRALAPRDGTPMDVFPDVQEVAAGAAVSAKLGIDFGGKSKEVSYDVLARLRAQATFVGVSCRCAVCAC